MSTNYYALDSHVKASTAEACFVPWTVLFPLVFGRFAIRLQTYGRVYEDDVACFLAFAASVACSAVSYIYQTNLTEGSSPIAGYSGTYTGWTNRPANLVPIMNCLTFFGFSAAKISVLFLYRDLFWISGIFRKFWRAAFVYLLLSTIVMMGLSASTIIEAESYEKTGTDKFYAVGYSKPMICTYLDIIGSLMVMGVPLWIFPSIHLRHSVNWCIGLVYCTGIAGFALAITGVVLSSSVENTFMASLALLLELGAASLLGYTPICLPDQRRRLWPWSKRASRLKDPEQQENTSAENLIARKPTRKVTFGSLTSLVHRDTSSNLVSIEMHNLQSSLEDIRPYNAVSDAHAQGRGLETDTS